ncbi:MAG: HD domain-containing protein, partial [Promethearchaeota archaeon]
DMKATLEARAVESILSPLDDLGVSLQSLWAELQEGKSIEARVVRSSDLLDMLVHAITLERSGVDSEILQGFFEPSKKKLEKIGIELSLGLYGLLESKHRK